MTGQTSWYIVLIGTSLFVGSALLGAGLPSFFDPSAKSFRRHTPEGEVLFRKPFLERASMGLFSLSSVGGILIWLGIAFDPMTVGGPGGLLLVVPPCLGVSIWFLRRAGPEEVFLDLKAHEYRRVTGWPVFPTIISGSLEQLSGVYVRHVNSIRSSPYHLVGLYWSGKKKTSVIGHFDYKEDAENEAGKLQLTLNLHRLPPPQ